MRRIRPFAMILQALRLSPLLILGPTLAFAAGDFGTWHGVTVRALDIDRWSLTAMGQMRFRDNSSEPFTYLLGPQLAYRVSPCVQLGSNYTCLAVKPGGRQDFVEQHRWEIEVNPRWAVSDWLTFGLRNRFELAWTEGRSNTGERSRHRPQATIRTKGTGPLESLNFNNEIFYDYDAHRYNQNRFIPLGLNFRVNPHAVFSTYYMLWSVRGSREWLHSHVLGTQLSMTF